MGVTFASLVERGYPVFALDDLAGEAARKLADGGFSAAPVLDGDRYSGMVTLAALLEGRKGWPSPKALVRSARVEPVPGFSMEAQLLDNISAVAAVESEIIALLDDQLRYAGVVRKRAIFQVLALRFHTGEEGATLEIEVPPPGVRLSEMIAALEKNDASVRSYSSMPSGATGEGQILSFRVVTHDFFRLVRNMEKYGYLISYHSPFPDVGYDEMREKALEFIRYMDM